MVVSSIFLPCEGLELSELGGRLYRLEKRACVRVGLEDGTEMDWAFSAGFVTNFRSGGRCVDWIIPQLGDTLHQICWLVHDANYTPCDIIGGGHPVSKKEADALLGAMLRYSGESEWKIELILASVTLFGKSAYSDDDSLTPNNRTKFGYKKWTAPEITHK